MTAVVVKRTPLLSAARASPSNVLCGGSQSISMPIPHGAAQVVRKPVRLCGGCGDEIDLHTLVFVDLLHHSDVPDHRPVIQLKAHAHHRLHHRGARWSCRRHELRGCSQSAATWHACAKGAVAPYVRRAPWAARCTWRANSRFCMRDVRSIPPARHAAPTPRPRDAARWRPFEPT